MRKVILHIGRHKTGTTSIQRFLYRNRSILLDHGYLYPEYGIRECGHHEIGAPLTRSSLSRSTQSAKDILRSMRQHLHSEIANNDATVVISSESFQNCDPQVIKSLFDGCEVNVVVYIREQVRYLLSAYAQRVQATDYCGSLEDFFHLTSHTTYQKFLEKWDSAFSSRLTVKNYDREELIHGDVVTDFCQSVLDIDSKIVKEHYCQVHANPSLTRDLLDFKIWVNKNLELSSAQLRILFHAMSRLSLQDDSGSVQISPELAREIEQRYQESNSYVAKHYFRRNRLFPPFSIQSPSDPSVCRETRIAAVREKLIADVPELEMLLPVVS